MSDLHPEVKKAMDQAEAGLSAEDKQILLDSIVWVAMEQPEFTADDVWAHAGIIETRGLGPLMRKASMAGICTKIGYVPKRSAQGGRWQFTLWRSNVYESPETK